MRRDSFWDWVGGMLLWAIVAGFIVGTIAIIIGAFIEHQSDFAECKADGLKDYECRGLLRGNYYRPYRSGRR